jgi:hypothetical protein
MRIVSSFKLAFTPYPHLHLQEDNKQRLLLADSHLHQLNYSREYKRYFVGIVQHMGIEMILWCLEGGE